MAKTWEPSLWGRFFTGSRKWRLRLEDRVIELTIDNQLYRAPVDGDSTLRMRQGLFWTAVTLFPGHAGEKRLEGLPNSSAATLIAMVATVNNQRLQQDLEFLADALSTIRGWLDRVSTTLRRAEEGRRWITYESQQALLNSRPSFDGQALWLRLRNPAIRQRLCEDLATAEKALNEWETDWPASWVRLNAAFVRRELIACKDIFDRVESKPLTEEQARAVICFDNRVQVVASAGSGKTSTMVAKAAYAIHRGFMTPAQIVLLAFNKQAAQELKQRAALAFERLGMTGITLETATFHALGLQIIGKAAGRKPDIPDWAIDASAGFHKLTTIIDQLKDGSPEFRIRWDLFRLVFARDLPAFGAETVADSWDNNGRGYVRTLNGERVRSQEERRIADWLFYNGVDYNYERHYEFDTATDTHRQYSPDFYYPQIHLYHEHFALDEHGQAPAGFTDYLAGVAWKRQLHRHHKTHLIETTSHQLRGEGWMDYLGKALTDRGVVLDPNPDRPIPNGGEKPMDHAELTGLLRTFISHAKSNCLGIEALNQRLAAFPKGAYTFRYRMFLAIAGPVMQAWDNALSAEGGIDFEDMLNLAAGHLEQGRYETPYKLVMADEFQDASRARARLCRAMVQKPGRHFFAVGDDWQSINRFAGADLSVMTGFRQWFGQGQVLKLEQTFRCPQTLCDVSSRFISRNPSQIDKRVHSVTPAINPILQAFQVDHRDKLQSAIDRFLHQLCQGLNQGRIPPGRDGKVSVVLLGRYNAELAYLPERWKDRYGKWVELSFLTIHRSKGSEADYVILPAMISALRGRSFPNTRTDDPVLALAMPNNDNFPLSEERRLFYVALTRARRSVAMFTARGQRSVFLDELVEEQAVVITNIDGEAIDEQRCPACKQGVIVTRNGPYGEFESCSNYPLCEHKPIRKKTRDRVTFPRPPSSHALMATINASRPSMARQKPSPGSTVNPDHPAPAPRTRRLEPSIQEPPAHEARTNPTLRGLLGAIANGIEVVNKEINRSLALQEATVQLEKAIKVEQDTIAAALMAAKRMLDIQEKADADPEFAKACKTSDDRLQILLAARPTQPEHAKSPVAVPVFDRGTRHANPDIEAAIQRKRLLLRDAREAFLSAVHAELYNSGRLCSLFRDNLHALEGDRYWTALDSRPAPRPRRTPFNHPGDSS